jgi:NADP-dependent 3-hydroxy acid dehydrogenase YdfG
MTTAIVTGGSGDIGRACAEALIADGYRVGILDLASNALTQIAAEIGATPLAADVTNEPAVERALVARCRMSS